MRARALHGPSYARTLGEPWSERGPRPWLRRIAIDEATTPTAIPTAVSTPRRIGCCHASCGLTAATTIRTAVVTAVVITSSVCRYFLRQAVESTMPNLFFLAHSEIPAGIKVISQGVIQ